MTPERHARLRELFLTARELPSAARASLLARCRADDPDLAEPLAELLVHVDTRSALDAPALGDGFALGDVEALADDPARLPLPERIGDYRILGILGVGGMGVVYLGQQRAPHREVAIKVLRARADDPSFAARFRFEVQALGRLQHPGVAAIFEAGTHATELGLQPFFVMERIDGESLLEHVAARRSDRRARIALAIGIVEAIQHAHQRGVVHLDLKPGNVLVDREGRTKVLDFGIAAVRDAEVAVQDPDGASTRAIGTPAYMSPEQRGGDARSVDTRSDIWSLGVMLHQLLTGSLPFADGDDPTSGVRIAARQLGPDLAAVVQTTLAARPDDRYADAGDLAADLARVLRHEPVAARRAGTLRRAVLFARRHRGLTVGASAAALALALGLAATGMALGDARDARDLAESRLQQARTAAERADAVRGLVLGMLNRIDPNGPVGERGIDRMLGQVMRDVESRFAAYPDLEAELRLVLGGVLRLFGRVEPAREQIERSIAIYTRLDGPRGTATLDARCAHLAVLRDEEALDAIRDRLPALLADCEAVFGPTDERTLACHLVGVRCLLVESAYLEAHTRIEGLAARVAHLQDGAALPIEIDVDLRLSRADGWIAVGRIDIAEEQLVDGLSVVTAARGADDPLTMEVASALAKVRHSRGDHASAAELFARVRTHRASRLPGAHPLVLEAEHDAGLIASAQGRHVDAVAHFRRAADGRALVYGPRNVRCLTSLLSAANASGSGGRPDLAEPLFAEVLARLAEDAEVPAWFAPSARGWNAVNDARLGHFERAAAALRAVIAELDAIDPGRSATFRDMLAQLERRMR